MGRGTSFREVSRLFKMVHVPLRLCLPLHSAAVSSLDAHGLQLLVPAVRHILLCVVGVLP